MREWRRAHPLTGEPRMKMNSRAYAHVYRDRGKIGKKPCAKCGSDKAEMHHEDYSRPLDVIFLCRECHLKEHAERRKPPT